MIASMLIKRTTTDTLRLRNVPIFTVPERCYVKRVKILYSCTLT